MKQTALQQAFRLLEELEPNLFNIYTEKGRTFVNTFHDFIEIEKVQIIKAFNEGTFAQDEKITAEQYYNETFKSE